MAICVAGTGYIHIEAEIHLLVFISFELFKLMFGFCVITVRVRTSGREFNYLQLSHDLHFFPPVFPLFLLKS